MADLVPELVEGPAFHLEGDGRWDVQDLPEEVLRDALFSGEIDIEGYHAVVFEMPDGDQWAQKAPGTPSPKGDGVPSPLLAMASRVSSFRTSRMNLDEGELRSAAGVLDELASAVESLGRAARHGRGLRNNPSLEWIADQLDSSLDSVSGSASGIREALEYLTRD